MRTTINNYIFIHNYRRNFLISSSLHSFGIVQFWTGNLDRVNIPKIEKIPVIIMRILVSLLCSQDLSWVLEHYANEGAPAKSKIFYHTHSAPIPVVAENYFCTQNQVNSALGIRTWFRVYLIEFLLQMWRSPIITTFGLALAKYLHWQESINALQ